MNSWDFSRRFWHRALFLRSFKNALQIHSRVSQTKRHEIRNSQENGYLSHLREVTSHVQYKRGPVSDLTPGCSHSLYRECQANIDVTVPCTRKCGRHTRGRAVFMSLWELATRRDIWKRFSRERRDSDRERMSDRDLIHLTDTSRPIERTFVARDMFQRAKIALRDRCTLWKFILSLYHSFFYLSCTFDLAIVQNLNVKRNIQKLD